MKTNEQKNVKSKLGLFFTLNLLLFSLLFISQSQAQVGFSIGPKAGVSVNQFDKNDNGFSARTAWAAGVFANLHLGEVFSLQPEFLIHQKGAQQNVNGTKNEIKLNYFSVPVLAKLMLPIQGTFYPHILAGPVYNYRLNAKYSAVDNGSGTTISFNDGDLKRTEIAGAFGAGFDIISNNIYLNLDARYNVGFSDLNDNDNTIVLRNRNWTVMAGVGFRFGTPK
jgi:hypothetical protein